VIGKISAPRGKRVEPLVRYLFGPGRREEHTDPHIVAGFRHPAALEPPLRPDGTRDFSKLNGLLNQPNDALGSFAMERPVWHCALRAAPEDKILSDDEWAQIAHDVMNRTGLARHGKEDGAVRWIAVRHAQDHIHLVVMLARQDGRRSSVRNDRYRVRDACRDAEHRYGLRSTSPADRTAPRYPTRAENEKATRRGLDEAPRVTLCRAVNLAAAASATAQEFFAQLETAGITVRQRHSSKNPGQVTGYAVALDGHVTKDGKPVWYSGGKLAADLTWPKLALRWHPARQVTGIRLTDAERAAMFEHAAKAAADATANIRAFGATSPGAAADAAQAAADTLHVAAAILHSRPLREAAGFYERAAREPFGRIPPPTKAGNHLRQAARVMAAYAHLSGDRTNQWAIVIIRLAALAEALAELRETQQRAAQARGALTAARQLHVVRFAPPSQPPGPPRARNAADLAAQSFTGPPVPARRSRAPAAQHGADQAARPARRPTETRPRGPSR
jgi:hypothetical protein